MPLTPDPPVTDPDPLKIDQLAPIDVSDGTERLALREALTSSPKEIPPKYLYDALGSELFESLTDLPEYYPSRAELEILEEHGLGIMRRFRPEELVEIGSGSSRKTRVLIEAMHSEGGDRYAPLDVSEDAIREAGEALTADYPWLQVTGIVADFHADLSEIEHTGRRMVAFLGGTVGNLYGEERSELLGQLRSLVRPGDALLLGFDLIKDRATLEAAYDDRQGKTKDFIFNVLDVMNREYDADFDPEAFQYESHWDPERHWVEMRLVSRRAQRVRVGLLDLDLDFEAGEHLRAEVSTKFTPSLIEGYLGEAGFEVERVLTDSAGQYGLAVAIPAR